MPYQPILSDNFETNPASKAETQQCVRDHFFQLLIERDYDPIKTLLILHKLTTFNTHKSEISSKINPDSTILGLSMHAASWDNLLKDGVVKRNTPNLDELTVKRPSTSGKGRFRILATLESEWGEEDIYTPIGIALRSEFLGSGEYVAPNIAVPELMNQLGSKYTQLIESLGRIDTEYKLVQFLIYSVFFYMIGCNFMHPFEGGNHRTFDRFMELEFRKAGLDMSLPQDETSNIPPTDQARKFMTIMLVNFMFKEGISLGYEPMNPREYFTYTMKLETAIERFIETSLDEDGYKYLYLNAAKHMLPWVNLVGTDLYRQKAEKIIDKQIKDVKSRLDLYEP